MASPLLTSAHADPLGRSPRSGGQSVSQEVLRPAGAGLVRGTVIDASDRAVPNVTVRLRDVETGRILDLKRTDTTGAFTFEQVPPGRYVVEVLDANGNVIGVSQPFIVSADNPVDTLIRLRGKLKGTSVLFSNTATAIIAAAAAIGFAAWAQTGQAVSPQR